MIVAIIIKAHSELTVNAAHRTEIRRRGEPGSMSVTRQGFFGLSFDESIKLEVCIALRGADSLSTGRGWSQSLGFSILGDHWKCSSDTHTDSPQQCGCGPDMAVDAPAPPTAPEQPSRPVDAPYPADEESLPEGERLPEESMILACRARI